jgi:UPF0755 protein
LWLAYGLLLPAGPTAEKFVMLRPGSSARSIAYKLRDQGIIRSSSAFLLWHVVKLRTLKAGEYRFDHPANALEVYDRVARGDIYVRTVVIPEGYNIFDIGNAIEVAGLGAKREFLKIAQDPAMIRDLDPEAPSLEGFLFPDTYAFTRTQTVRDIATAMTHRFRQEAKSLGLTAEVHRVVTLASIVEKETGRPDERPRIACVFHNRLKSGMRLQTDPSVMYATLLRTGRWSKNITRADLLAVHPYNTYTTAGLPPGPIANPGAAALRAALSPSACADLYFVSRNDGSHVFCPDLRCHNAAVKKFQVDFFQHAQR